MPRPLRIEYAGAWYHVMNRGAGCQIIYKTPEHRNQFLSLLAEARKLFDLEIHGYCLMGNHYHLLLRTPKANLSRAMRHINGVYTQRYNRLEETDGPLFRGRYKAVLIDSDSYLLQVSRYIHLNPVEAKIAKKPEAYPWSSYRAFTGLQSIPDWLETQAVLGMVSQKHTLNTYKSYVEEGLDDATISFYEKTKQSVILGTQGFKEKLLKNLSEQKKQATSPDYKRTRQWIALDKIVDHCARHYEVEARSIVKAQRGHINMPRKIAAYLCRMHSGEPLTKIAEYFNCNAISSVSHLITNTKSQISKSKKLNKQVELIEKAMTHS